MLWVGENSNESTDCLTCAEFLQQLRNYWFLRNRSDSCNYGNVHSEKLEQVLKQSSFMGTCCATIYLNYIFSMNQSQWQRGLCHEESSPVQTLGSWLRISLEAVVAVAVLLAADSQSTSSSGYRACLWDP
jgi:hypothetical protein